MKKLTVEEIEEMSITSDGAHQFYGWMLGEAKRSPRVRKAVESFANCVLEWPGYRSDNKTLFTPRVK